MGVFQSYNGRIKAYVKGEMVKKKNGGTYFKALNVKESKPGIPFKGVPIRKKK